jgi:hypothetical protein
LRDDVRESGGALDDVRPYRREEASRATAAPVSRSDILLGQGHVPPYAPRFSEGCQSAARTKRQAHSLPLSTYSELGGLPQDPGRAAGSSAGPSTDKDMGARRACVVVDLWALGARVRVGALPDSQERPAGSSEGRQREMRTCPTKGSTELQIRPAGAGRRSTAASEVSR